jgi:hypothetical protein
MILSINNQEIGEGEESKVVFGGNVRAGSTTTRRIAMLP